MPIEGDLEAQVLVRQLEQVMLDGQRRELGLLGLETGALLGEQPLEHPGFLTDLAK